AALGQVEAQVQASVGAGSGGDVVRRLGTEVARRAAVLRGGLGDRGRGCWRAAENAGPVRRQRLGAEAQAGREGAARQQHAQGERREGVAGGTPAHGPVSKRWTCSDAVIATGTPRVTVPEPPPAGTVALPLLDV